MQWPYRNSQQTGWRTLAAPARGGKLIPSDKVTSKICMDNSAAILPAGVVKQLELSWSQSSVRAAIGSSSTLDRNSRAGLPSAGLHIDSSAQASRASIISRDATPHSCYQARALSDRADRTPVAARNAGPIGGLWQVAHLFDLLIRSSSLD
ncbi:uncharacterized protein L969DRAFT_93217 [Mixia osmundae IAM 14324]|uniref:Uncharacterized protein n=1 Tax=Mixia osmundae (strain CBS 9802 / IAM 14324 / JCM 22182 / KY 12970) TaxID=764103 RepID=G7E5R5_MIXOS|nr:uncharacterized protein L969DRAFT_93217 [Mixia osmundae IAM 14324]KEI40675.1 hypothetical protein L969DRAFT_93217 [Mixia osmundae IAM 14324]GAA98175.1 hypothetical protein E5Q_04858 [Mixia osmundae IAM 14324]